ncbi:hypothetical protein AYK25_10240 [Thermoplasmatales archaeon SM1-50]|nr:MAG: hypothetical protein AYK25_10240 [Thermoplasmatales archaeon SM1-50]
MLKNSKLNRIIFLVLLSQIFTAFFLPSLIIAQTSAVLIQPVDTRITSSDIIKMIQEVNTSTLRKHVQTIQDFGPHKTGSESLKLVGDYIYNQLISTTLPVEYFEWSTRKFFGKNIIATLEGTSKADGVVIVCAHYDSIEISPGADDDASGVAIVLQLAKIMSTYTFNSTIKFILFSGEEQGKLGSSVYAKATKTNKENIIGVLALDKVGYAVTADEGRKVVHHSNSESDWMVDISIKMTETYRQYIDLEVLRWSQDPASDHLSFVNEGYHGTDFVRYAVNPFYHTSEDRIEHMNLTYLTKVCNLTLATLSTIAGLNPFLTNDDLNVVIKGTFLSRPAQLSISVENKGYERDTANVTIDIRLKHMLRSQYVITKKEHYEVPCNWSVTKEIDKRWEFFVDAHTFTRGLCILEVVVQGINDDVYLYEREITYGFIIHFLKVRVLPRW